MARPPTRHLTPDTSADLKRLVALGYDRIAEDSRWQERWSSILRMPPLQLEYLAAFLQSLPPQPRLLDLGCGDGGPYLPWLSQRAVVTGLDLARGQLVAAHRRTAASLVQGDMGRLPFASAAAFDGVLALYSIIHLPRWEHASLFASLRELLRPGGMLLAVLGAGDTPGGWEEDWFGSRMYWSHYDIQTGLRLLCDAGFAILDNRVEPDYTDPQAAHLFVLAQRER